MKGQALTVATSGAILDFSNLTNNTPIHLTDIAQGLVGQMRFCGQTKHTWTVAQHSMLVAHFCSPEYKYEALLHDATEAYLCDIPKGIKTVLPDYRELERRLDQIIRHRFNLPDKISTQVKEADKMALRVEAFTLTDIPFSIVAKPSKGELEEASEAQFMGSRMLADYTTLALSKEFIKQVREAELCKK